MARFCEEFTDYSLLMFAANNQQVPAKLISDKISFLQELPSLGSQRSAALTLEGPGATPWDTLNVSGLKHRVSRMLGFPEYTRKFLSPGDFKAIVFYQEADDDGLDEYRFRIVDENGQILLSSVKAYKVFESGYDIVLEVIAAGKNVSNYRIFPSVDGQFYFNLYNGADAEPIARRIDLFPTQQEAESRRDEVVTFMISHFEGINDEPEEGVHIVEHLILRPRFKEGKGPGKIEDPLMPVVLDDFGNLTDEGKDPYSFRITAVFPAGAKKLQDSGFKALADRLLRLETPAHVMPQVFFVDNIQMSRFEYAWKRWLELRMLPVPENPLQKTAHLQDLSQALKELIAAMQFLPEPY
jgi:hypothetical protein